VATDGLFSSADMCRGRRRLMGWQQQWQTGCEWLTHPVFISGPCLRHTSHANHKLPSYQPCKSQASVIPAMRITSFRHTSHVRHTSHANHKFTARLWNSNLAGTRTIRPKFDKIARLLTYLPFFFSVQNSLSRALVRFSPPMRGLRTTAAGAHCTFTHC
jgi:hypothetical protein